MAKLLTERKQIPTEYFGQRLDVALAKLFPEFSRSQLSQWLKQELITINNHSGKPKDKVLGGEEVCLFIDKVKEAKTDEINQPEKIPLNIVYEDEEIIVINKPAGLVVHPGAGQRQHTLVNALLYHNPTLRHLPRAGLIHRLDKETTGLLVIAKTLQAQTQLVRQMQGHLIQRQYIALVQGHLISGGRIETFYGRHPKNRLKMAVCQQGRQALTLYSIRKHYNFFTLLDVNLMTGRTHQIRVHMAHIHHPIVGDPLYGTRMRFPNDELKPFLQNFKRQALHAAQLSFSHPKNEKPLTFIAELPDDFQNLINALESLH